MTTTARMVVCAIGAAFVLGTGITTAQADFPEKSIEFIIPFGAGGGADIEGRVLAEEMGKELGVRVIPINKPGGGGAVTYNYLHNAAPDGYTVAWSSTSILTSSNLGNVPFEYDALDHVGQVEWQPMPFVANTDSPWQTFEDFVKDCTANPGKYKVANSGTGSATHLAAIALMTAANCEVTHLPVGISRRNASVLSGEADAMVAPLTGALNLTKAGKLRLLVVTSSQRNSVVPDVPTAMELGFDVNLPLFRGLAVPPGTPDDVKARLADAMIKATNSDAFTSLAEEVGFTVEPLAIHDFGEVLAVLDAEVKEIMQQAGLYKSGSQ